MSILNVEIHLDSGLTNTPTIVQWLNSENISDGGYVGVDRTLITHSEYNQLCYPVLVISCKSSVCSDLTGTIVCSWQLMLW